MAKLDSRVEALERTVEGLREIRIYQQDRWGHSGLYRRYVPKDETGRLMTHAEVEEDGAGAQVILITYEDTPGALPALDAQAALDVEAAQIWLQDNG